MGKTLAFLLALFGTLPAAVQPSARLPLTYPSLPMRFEPNQGQADPRARFVARGAGYAVLLGPAETALVLRNRAALRMKLLGAEPRAIVLGEGVVNGATLCRFSMDVRDGSSQGIADTVALTIDCGEVAGPRYKTPEPVPVASGNITLHHN